MEVIRGWRSWLERGFKHFRKSLERQFFLLCFYVGFFFVSWFRFVYSVFSLIRCAQVNCCLSLVVTIRTSPVWSSLMTAAILFPVEKTTWLWCGVCQGETHLKTHLERSVAFNQQQGVSWQEHKCEVSLERGAVSSRCSFSCVCVLENSDFPGKIGTSPVTLRCARRIADSLTLFAVFQCCAAGCKPRPWASPHHVSSLSANHRPALRPDGSSGSSRHRLLRPDSEGEFVHLCWCRSAIQTAVTQVKRTADDLHLTIIKNRR